jgi:hypothetical protein
MRAAAADDVLQFGLYLFLKARFFQCDADIHVKLFRVRFVRDLRLDRMLAIRDNGKDREGEAEHLLQRQNRRTEPEVVEGAFHKYGVQGTTRGEMCREGSAV